MKPTEIRKLLMSKSDKKTAERVYNCLKTHYIPKTRYDKARARIEHLTVNMRLLRKHLTFEQYRLRNVFGCKVTSTPYFKDLLYKRAEPIALDKQE